MKKLPILLIAITAFLAGCSGANTEADQRKDGFSNTAATPEDSLFQLVMDGHDVGMSKMSKLKTAQKELQEKIDSLSKLSVTPQTISERQSLSEIMESLSLAEFGMNTWMEEFNADSATDDPQTRLEYLKNEQEKVEKVRGTIIESLRLADSATKK